MKQRDTSKGTSVNSVKLPRIYNKVDFDDLMTCCGLLVFDYGCGKYDNAKDFIEGMGGTWWGYDPYNRPEVLNNSALFWEGYCDCLICSNVLNVIAEDDIIERLVYDHFWTETPFFVTVYEGNRTGKGAVSKEDCYQRNERVQKYLKYFPEGTAIYKGVITNAPQFIK